ISRDNFKRTYGTARFSPRPKNSKLVRKYTFQGNVDYFRNGAGQRETQITTGRFNLELNNSDQFTIDVNNNYELLLRPTPLLGVTAPVGGYDFRNTAISYAFGAQRRASGTVSMQAGQFYNGTLTTVGFSSGRVSVVKQLSFEPTISINRFETPAST